MDIRDTVLAGIGNTPLVKLRRASEETGCTILGKAESMNPGHSVKDRAALGIITDAIDKGQIGPGGLVVEGTAGNTGIGLTVVANALGMRTVIVIPETQSQEKKDTLRSLGATLVEVPAVPYRNDNNYVKVAARMAERLSREHPQAGYMAGLADEFAKRNTKVIGLSVDPVGAHEGWAQDIKDVTGNEVNFPMIGDHDLKVAKLYNMLPADAGETSEGRTAANNATVRTVYIVGPDKLIKAMLIYPMSTGRNFDEVLRLLDSIQLTAKHSVATPVNWNQGEDCIIVPSLSDEAAREKFPNGWKTVKPYLRTVPQPADEAAAEQRLTVEIIQ
jgi:alkyl hydroperoxide reductase subunit AhpC